jgi:hypothetical protein
MVLCFLREAGLHLSNLLTALGLAIRDTLILESYLKILPILNPLRSLMLPTHFIIASVYLHGKHFRTAYQVINMPVVILPMMKRDSYYVLVLFG